MHYYYFVSRDENIDSTLKNKNIKNKAFFNLYILIIKKSIESCFCEYSYIIKTIYFFINCLKHNKKYSNFVIFIIIFYYLSESKTYLFFYSFSFDLYSKSVKIFNELHSKPIY